MSATAPTSNGLGMYGIHRCVLAVTLLALLSGCGARPVSTASRPGVSVDALGASPPPLTDAEVRSVIASAVALRGLEEREPIAIEWVDDDGWQQVERPSWRAGTRKHSRRRAVDIMLAFDMLERDTFEPVGPPRASAHSLLGAYRPATRRVYMRTDALDGDGDRRTVLAHEATHALQHQHFDLLDTSATNMDESNAHEAVIEGDATLVQLSYVLKARGQLSKLDDVVSALVMGDDAEQDGGAFAHGRRVAALSEQFPYMQGASFMHRLRARGGVALMNRAFTRPPTATEHILHLDKYLAGERPMLLERPAPPRHARLVHDDRLGEWWTSLVLSRCLTAEHAQRAAAGWGGDAFSIIELDRERIALLWTTAWDDEAEAREFEAAVREHGCRQARWAGPERRIEAGILVERRGQRVAIARGLDELDARGAVDAMLAAPLAKPPPRPPAK